MFLGKESLPVAGLEQEELQGPFQAQPEWDCDSGPHAAPSLANIKGLRFRPWPYANVKYANEH